MLIRIANVLVPEEVAKVRALLGRARWVDGRVTAGPQSAEVKRNSQVPEDDPRGREAAAVILSALNRNELFTSAALPHSVFPPLFNRYAGGEAFGSHVDNAIRSEPTTGRRIRTDLSATLFLEDPANYDGGELVVEDSYGTHAVKLPKGHMVLYPATSLHHVTPVSRGARLASFFWIQSMVREDAQRALLFGMDRAIMRLSAERPGHPSAVEMTSCYHNLIRMWADL